MLAVKLQEQRVKTREAKTYCCRRKKLTSNEFKEEESIFYYLTRVRGPTRKKFLCLLQKYYILADILLWIRYVVRLQVCCWLILAYFVMKRLALYYHAFCSFIVSALCIRNVNRWKEPKHDPNYSYVSLLFEKYSCSLFFAYLIWVRNVCIFCVIKHAWPNQTKIAFWCLRRFWSVFFLFFACLRFVYWVLLDDTAVSAFVVDQWVSRYKRCFVIENGRMSRIVTFTSLAPFPTQCL